MARRWVENTGSEPKLIGGKWLQKGEGTWVDDGPLSDPPAAQPFMATPAQAAALQSLVSGAGISYADVATVAGTPGERRILSDGPDAGVQLVWAMPEGSSAYAWCWSIYPLASYL